MSDADPFDAIDTLEVGDRDYRIHRLDALGERVSKLPYTVKVVLEAALRNCDGFQVQPDHVEAIAAWKPDGERGEIPFKPGRVVLQDFTGVPAVVDLAAMRDAVKELGGDPERINPQVPCDLVIDHSVQVDFYGDAEAEKKNLALEFRRNRERYEFLRWGQQAFRNFRVVPPATGIVHQVNLEYLAAGVLSDERDGVTIAYPDSLVGTDSHTTMINGIGVLGWGVGGIEAEAVMLGQPIFMLLPDVVGVELTGTLAEGATATDLVLTVTEMLRAEGVVGKFVEFCGPGLAGLPLADRATIANMAPEYGATCGFFPVDEETLRYLRLTGRDPERVALVEAYCREQGLFAVPDAPTPEFTRRLKLDLGGIEPCLAGPKRPQDRIPLGELGENFRTSLSSPSGPQGFGLDAGALARKAQVAVDGATSELPTGGVAIAAITSCTNTSNPRVLMAAGLLAEKAVAKGLKVAPYVKTSLAPGSRVVTAYLEKAGLQKHLDALGFQVVGYGCTTCIGNSGPLRDEIATAIREHDLVVASVLSGNRNFEGRINPDVKANYLASPPLVVAFALAGRVDVDLQKDPLGTGSDGQPVHLADIWPTPEEVEEAVAAAVSDELFRDKYASVFDGPEDWQAVEAPTGDLYAWKDESTYIQNPPFFEGMGLEPDPPRPIEGARVLALLGDSVTTDHISPAGAIADDGPAARYLREHGVERSEFNSFGSRRGNDRVMTRGTFANVRLRNLLVPGVEGGYTVHHSSGEQMSIYDAARRYREDGTPLVVLAGKEYGTGSSRDWAAKGTALLGVRAVIAESYERIHRSNLVGMGVLPLQFADGESAKNLGLDGTETFAIRLPEDGLEPRQELEVVAEKDGKTTTFTTTVRCDTPVDVRYYEHGGILKAVLRQLLEG